MVAFAHRTFLDHLGARYAVEEGHLDVLLGHAGDTQREDVVLMAVAHTRTRERTTVIRTRTRCASSPPNATPAAHEVYADHFPQADVTAHRWGG
ncbi:hypothetical protein [Streptomyces sp. NPDC017964]|uniref:hypothetical protein n=1 Tax=Streptomyces sp. NPDC017964 TaxID=3365022 RepID=UPI00378EC165